MDLWLLFRVLWRFRLLTIVGVALAAELAIISVASISFDGATPKLRYRTPEKWTSTSTVWVTQEGFPLGRSVYDQFLKTGSPSDPTTLSKFSDPSRFSSFATVYASLVGTDVIESIMLRQGPIKGTVGATQPTVPLGTSAIGLPFVNVYGTADSPAAAVALSRRATRALVTYVTNEQRANQIDKDKRVILDVVTPASEPQLTGPRSWTRPIVVFLAVLLATIGLAFLLENLRPRPANRAKHEAPERTPPAYGETSERPAVAFSEATERKPAAYGEASERQPAAYGQRSA